MQYRPLKKKSSEGMLLKTNKKYRPIILPAVHEGKKNQEGAKDFLAKLFLMINLLLPLIHTTNAATI